MNDLTTIYAHARYDRALGHEKVAGILDKLFGLKELTPEQQQLRALMEQSVTDEQLARQKALAKLRAARERLTTGTQPGSATKLLDFARALVPGLSITAAPKDDGITKQSADLPEESVGGRAVDIAQALAVLGGAGVGAGIQRSAFGGYRAADIAARTFGTPRKLMEALREHADIGTDVAEALAGAAREPGANLPLAAQTRIPVLTRLSDIFSPSAWRARLRGEPSTSATAADDLARRATQRMQETGAGAITEAEQALRSARRAQTPAIEAIRAARATDPQAIGVAETARRRVVDLVRERRLLERQLRVDPTAAVQRAEVAVAKADDLLALAQRNYDAISHAPKAAPQAVAGARNALERAMINRDDVARRAQQAGVDVTNRLQQALAKARATTSEAVRRSRTAHKTVAPSLSALRSARHTARATAEKVLSAKRQLQDLQRARAGAVTAVRTGVSRLSGGLRGALRAAKPVSGWRAGAGIGALALALPLALLKYQQVQALRRRGGTAAASSYREATEALQRVEKLKQWRQQQLKALPV